MKLIVVDPGVLADAFEAEGVEAKLLTLLAYGSAARALHQLTTPEELLSEYPDFELRGLSFDVLTEDATRRWETLHQRLAGHSTDWGLATSGGDLMEMRRLLELGRDVTRLVPYRAWLLALQLTSATASDEEIEICRSRVPQAPSRATLIALAVGARCVVRRDGAPLKSFGLKRRHWPRRPHLRLAHPVTAEPHVFTHEGQDVNHYTMSEFLADGPRLDGIAGSMELLERAYFAGPLRA